MLRRALPALLALAVLTMAPPSHAEEGDTGGVPMARPLSDTTSGTEPGKLDDISRLFNEASLPPETPSAEPAPATPATDAGASGSAVAGIRLGDHGDGTRFVIELTGAKPSGYRLFTLADPYRVVVDFPNFSSRLPENAGENGRGIIADYRYGEFQNDMFRVVIDTKGPVAVARNFVLEPQGGFGRRVVIDLAPTDRETFLKTAGLPDAEKTPAATGSTEDDRPVTAPSSPTAHRERKRIVVIDPGHGGVDPGTHGRSSGVVEKDVVLAFGKELARRLRATGRYEVYMTRDKDIFIPLRGRIQIARAHHADLFISIHADSISKSDVRGMSVYTLSETASDKEAAALAKKENLSDVIAGIDFQGESKEVTGILIDLAQRETKNYSVRFAKSVVDYARHTTDLLDPTHRFAGFVVLKAPDVPSVLVELGFLTNRSDERQLTSAKWRGKVAGAFTQAVDRYFGDRLAEGPN